MPTRPSDDVVAVERRGVEPRGAARAPPPEPDLVDFHRDGNSVPAVLVVRGERGRPFFVEKIRRVRARRFVEIAGGEERRHVVDDRGVDHAQYAVAKGLDPAHAEDVERHAARFRPTRRSARASSAASTPSSTCPTSRHAAANAEYAVAFGPRREGDRPARQDALVVGMRVEGDEGAGLGQPCGNGGTRTARSLRTRR